MPSAFFKSSSSPDKTRRSLFRKSNRSLEGVVLPSTNGQDQQYPPPQPPNTTSTAGSQSHNSRPGARSQLSPPTSPTRSSGRMSMGVPSVVNVPRNRHENLPPILPSFDSEAGSAVGEPLINDFATRNIPEQFRPQRKMDGYSFDSSEDLTDTPLEATSIPVRKVSIPRSEENATSSLPPNARKQKSRENIAPSRAATIDAPRLVSPRQPQQHWISSSSTRTGPESQQFSSADSVISYETSASSVPALPPLQEKALYEDYPDTLEPLEGDDPGNFDLLPPTEVQHVSAYSLEQRSEELVSEEHLQEIFDDSSLLLKFTSFLASHRPQSMPLLEFYLDAMKALKAINYANSITESLQILPGFEFAQQLPTQTINSTLEAKAKAAFTALAQADLPAYVTHVFIQVVTTSIQRRITGTLPPHLREASEGLAEVFCLTDPSRPDNPIIFSSEEFHRTTQYGVNYAIGRNCRFLQGPRTNTYSVDRLRQAIKAGREVSEVFLNYRRDGSPFLNLLMIAPLLDSRGETRYFIGAQVDVSGLARDCTDLEGLQRLLAKREMERDGETPTETRTSSRRSGKPAFQQLSETLSTVELDVVRRTGGRMHREVIDETEDSQQFQHRPRLLLKDPSPDLLKTSSMSAAIQKPSGKLEGIYQNYLLIRPYPSLRILFCSPALRVPGMLQSPFLSRIGGSARVRDELTAAMAEGRGVTAKVRWISGKADDEGRPRWIHCTPLLSHTGGVGVWMVVIVDDDSSRAAMTKRSRVAPPVAMDVGGMPTSKQGSYRYPPPAIPLIPAGRQGNAQPQSRADSMTNRHEHNVPEAASASVHSFGLG